ncbi:MAG: CapA family protein [Paracoccaceae bacterium]
MYSNSKTHGETPGAARAAPRVAFVGDVMLGRKVNRDIARRPAAGFWGDCLGLLNGCSGVIGNLETPITTSTQYGRPALKAFRFRADPAAIDLLKAANFRAMSLANNHILDFGERAALESRDRLEAAGIAAVGVGCNAHDAVRPAIVDLGAARLGLIGITDNMPEWAATAGGPGVGHMPIREDVATMALLACLIDGLRRDGATTIVLSVHWGPNFRWWPIRRFRRFARAAIDAGVDIIHGHSAHLLLGVERYGAGVILYDTGNFIDDYWIFPGIRTDRTAIFTIALSNGRPSELVIHPAKIRNNSVALAAGSERETIIESMILRSRPLGSKLEIADGTLRMDLGETGARARPAYPAIALARS